jgi:hypothetical protein
VHHIESVEMEIVDGDNRVAAQQTANALDSKRRRQHH